MAHHGSTPKEHIESFRKLMQDKKALETVFGDTGQYPEGYLNKDDEGELRFGIARDGDKVVLNFGKEVAWIGFGADQAIQLAMSLVREAGRIKGIPVSLRIGRDE
jgi:hypothetical protein